MLRKITKGISFLLLVTLFMGDCCIEKICIADVTENTEQINEAIQPLSTTAYAYSVGVNHGTEGTYTGDFTPNVTYAKYAYARLSNVSSYQILTPTVSSLVWPNPNGDRIIASDIVFLNGHANPTQMIFNHNNNGGDYFVLVTSSTDSGNGPGLESTDMSSCKLISFVGCQTGKLSISGNLVRTAVAQGATVAVGFREDISSRTTAGQNWLKYYNIALSNGNSVSASIRIAVDAYPTSDLGTYVTLAGNPSNTVGTTASNASAMSDSQSATVSYPANINIGGLQDVAEADMTEDCYEEIVNKVKSVDSSFDASDYKITINRYDVASRDGVAILLYYIDGEVKTNRAYTCTIQDDVITEIKAINQNVSAVSTAAATRTTVLSEKNIMDIVQNYKATQEEDLTMQRKTNSYTTAIMDNECTVAENDIYSVREDFTYDYTTNTLLYEKVSFYTNKYEGGVIGDLYYSEVLY